MSELILSPNLNTFPRISFSMRVSLTKGEPNRNA